MKGRIISAAAIIGCLAVFLCACGTDAGSAQTQMTTASPWSEAQLFSIPAETFAQDGTAQDDTAQDGTAQDAQAETDTQVALRRIETARAVYGLFSETRPQLDKSDSVEIEDGLTAYRVTDPQLDTWDKLETYVSGYFSDDLTMRLMNIGIFTQVEDKLYALDVGMKPAKTAQPRVEVTQKTDTSEQYCLTVQADTDGDGVPDTDKTYNFVYAEQSDGKWVFTRFDSY